jgi:histidinol-phosphate aminotransferase
MALTGPRALVRPLVQRLQPYVPGEQPKITGLVKLNTNENPYPPSPKVLAAIKKATDGRLRLYPNPTAQSLREKLAKFHGCKPENIIVGNGSDELLAMAVRAFAEPAMSLKNRLRTRKAGKSMVQFFHPSYSLYPVLAAIHGATANPVPLDPDFGLPSIRELKRGHQWDFRAALTFITTPNAPSGHGYSTVDLQQLCEFQTGVIMLDEAYVDFAEENSLPLALKYPHVLVARTFSKAYSLCFQRIGYLVGSADLITALDKIRDSYNVNGLGQIAAMATLDDLPYYRKNFQKIVSTRQGLSQKLIELGFEVFPSQANFILVRPPRFSARDWLQKLRARKILVRWFDDAALRNFLRISIGTPNEVRALVSAARAILR